MTASTLNQGLGDRDHQSSGGPLVSIITATFNRAKHIRDAIESVLRQDYNNIEHIVVDGGSTDGTLEALKEYPHLKVISEPDDGVYDAFNKGIMRASGEIIGILNSDDLYADGILADVVELFAQDDTVDIVSGGAIVFEQTDGGVLRYQAEYIHRPQIAMTPENLALSVPMPNARFYRQEVFARIGIFDAKLKFAADRELLLRMIDADVNEVIIEKPLYFYRQHAGSLTIKKPGHQSLEHTLEHLQIAERFCNIRHVKSCIRTACKKWHMVKSIHGMLLSYRKRQIKLGFKFFKRGFIVNKSLLWELARSGLRRLFK